MTRKTERCDDTSCEILVSPMPTRRPRPLSIQTQPRARRVRFVDSTKNNSDAILSRARDALQAQGIPVDGILSKRRASQVMEVPLLDQLEAYEGLVVCTVND